MSTKKSVLVVDDTDYIRDLIVNIVARAGHYVASAENGEEGLLRFNEARASGNPFDLVWTDIQMPKLDGPHMAKAIRQVDQRVAIVFTSGNLGRSGYTKEKLGVMSPYFIPKPGTIDAFQNMLRTALGLL